MSSANANIITTSDNDSFSAAC
jgi:hypothetical protein